MLSNLFNDASSGLELSVEKVLHFAKSGSLAGHDPFTVCPNAGNTTLVPNSLTNNSPPLLAIWKGTCIPGIRAATFDTGLITVSAALAPIPNTKAPGLYNPYLAPIGNALPANANPTPNVAPSWPNLTLFINLAAAKSLPVLPSSLTGW